MRDVNIEREKLYDGTDENLKTFTFQLANNYFKLSDFYNNPFRDLKKLIDLSEFEQIINFYNFSKKESLIVNYYSRENLEIYFIMENNILYFISFGEFQPSRYMVFFEGIWKL